MKGYLLIAITIFILLTVVGCGRRPIPVASSYPVTAQHKMQAAYHWDVLATDVVKRLKKTLDLTFPNAVVKPSLYIRTIPAQEKSPFGKAFINLLITKLVQQGLVVLKDFPLGEGLIIEYDMQVVHHRDRRLTYPPPGLFTALAAGVWLVAQAQDRWQYPGLASIPFAVAGDVNSLVDYYLPGETNTEVIITTAVTMGQQYVFGDSSIYYINDRDYDHYDNENYTKTYQLVDQR
jgi:hypothetical protein